jgi:DNA-directed RNA polymerase subunit omega
MKFPPSNELLKKVDCRYSLVVMVSKRARQLVAGSTPMVPAEPNDKPVSIATMEVFEDKVHSESPLPAYRNEQV